MDIEYIKTRINKQEDKILLEKAYNFARKKLLEIKYSSSEILLNYILKITNILIDFNADNITLISSILYEIINCGINIDEIEREFNSTIANISYGMSQISDSNNLNNNKEKYINELNPNSNEDIRIMFIKLAERYYNMQNMNNSNIEQQTKIAIETLDILIPIASRLRLNYIKSKVEDLCLYYINPEIYNHILINLNTAPDTLKTYLNIMEENISNLLIENNIEFKIKGRVKSIYSIYNKLKRGRNWDDIYDILAIRILVETKEECQKVAKIIHSNYTPIPHRIKDYITNPKENMYQSFHTTITDIDNQYYEIQIRTYDMNNMAEIGSASHYLYKEQQLKKIKRK